MAPHPTMPSRPAVSSRPTTSSRPATASRPGVQTRPTTSSRPGAPSRPMMPSHQPVQKPIEPAGDLGRYGPFDILHNPPNAEVDIIAVHGLGSSYRTTWVHKGSGKMWLRDFLHLDFPKARIMTYSHNSVWKSHALDKDLREHGLTFLTYLEQLREKENAKHRPILFVGHSFGGLVIQQALVLAKQPNISKFAITLENYKCIHQSVAGVIFLGTPHGGSSYSTLGKLYCLVNFWDGANSEILDYMSRNSKETQQLKNDFLRLYQHLSFDFYETKPNKIFGMNAEMVVTKESATRPGVESCPLDTDHFELNKYSSRDDRSYIMVKNQMAGMLHDYLARGRAAPTASRTRMTR